MLVGILIGSVGILIGSVGILIGSVGILIHWYFEHWYFERWYFEPLPYKTPLSLKAFSTFIAQDADSVGYHVAFHRPCCTLDLSTNLTALYLESRGPHWPHNGVHKTQNMVKLKPCSASFAVAAGALSCLPTTLAC